MNTMTLFNEELSVVYVDVDNVSPGSGETPTTSLDALPNPVDFDNNTVYLCRRSDTLDTFSTTDGGWQNSSYLDNVYVLGMPISGDSYFDATPTEAISAWGSDVAEYYNMYNSSADTTTTNKWALNDVKNCGMHRVKFQQAAHTGNFDKLRLNGGSHRGKISITNCDFGTYNRDLTDPGMITNLDAKAPFGVNFYNFDTGTFRDNTFQYIAEYNSASYAYGGVLINGVRNVYFEDNESYIASQAANPAGYALYITGAYYTYFKRNEFKFIAQGYSLPEFPNVGYVYSYNIDAEDVTFTDPRYFYADFNSYSSIKHRSLMQFVLRDPSGDGTGVAQPYEAGTMKVKNIDVDFKHIKGAEGSLLFQTHKSTSNRNIELDRQWNENSITDITYSTGISGGWANESTTYPIAIKCERGKVDNIIVDNSDVTNTNATYSLSLYRVPLATNLELKGGVSLSDVGFAEINNLELDTESTNAVYLQNSVGYIKDLVYTGPTWGTSKWLYMYDTVSYGSDTGSRIQSRAIINNCDLPPTTIQWENDQIAKDTGVWINNARGIPGYWVAENYWYRGEAWGVNRSGGAEASIKLTSLQVTDSDTNLWIAPRHYKGIEVNPGVGSHTLKVYVAYVDLDLEDLFSRFKVYVTLDQGGGKTKELVSIMDGEWKDDASTWFGDPSVTKKVIEIPIEVVTAEPVTVRMTYGYNSPTGYMYLDPSVEVV
jgi:hypothetical protein